MRVLITRYPASEDRLIVRPLLCRRCALRLQPAEPQPYTNSSPAEGLRDLDRRNEELPVARMNAHAHGELFGASIFLLK